MRKKFFKCSTPRKFFSIISSMRGRLWIQEMFQFDDGNVSCRVVGIEKFESEQIEKSKVRTGLDHVWITGHKSFFIFSTHFHLTLGWFCLVYRTCWILLIFLLFTCRPTSEASEKANKTFFMGKIYGAHSYSLRESYLATFLSFNLLLTSQSWREHIMYNKISIRSMRRRSELYYSASLAKI